MKVNVSDLIFKKVPLMQAQQFFCNYCARPGFTAGWWQTKIDFAPKSEFKIVICSDTCLKGFKASPKSQVFVDESLAEMHRMHQLKTKRLIP